MANYNVYNKKCQGKCQHSLGQPVATQQVNGAAVEVAYNALGRLYQQRKLLSLSSTKFSNGKFQYRNPQPQSDISNMSGGGDGILTINHSDLDNMGQVIGQHRFDLTAGQTSGISLSSNNYVRHTLYFWYDQARRPIAQVNYGSGTSIWGYAALPTRPNTIPTESSDSLLLTQVVYDSTTGQLSSVVDPKGIVTKLDFDTLGRRNSVITNFVSGGTNNDQNLETQFIYNGLNAITLQTVFDPTTDNQITRYLYEDLYNALLQTSMILPNSSDTNSSGTNQIKKSYYLDGNIKTITDQNGTVRTIGYDIQRRMISDQVTTLGSGVDNTIVKFIRSYNPFGLLEKVSAYGTGNKVLNETKFDYDSNSRLIKKYDSHNGVVNIPNTPFLAYTYDDTATNGLMQNAGRLIGVDYPGGKHIEYSYNSQDSIDDILNRLNTITIDSLTISNYDYSGNNQLMDVLLPESGTSLNYQNGGLDRYGRIINHSWVEDSQPLVHIIHGYDYAGNRTHRYDAVHAASSELYSYDAVNQIKSLQRGELDNNFETVTNLTFSEEWNFDKTGNWLEYGKNGATQTRTANTANQILSINGNATTLAHDANGNMLKIPKPDESGNHFIFKYDAWNRVAAVYESDGSTKVAEYFYNGLGHRITKKTYVGGILTETRNYFYNEKWQCIKERVGATIDRTYVWGTRGIDDLIMRERVEERLYPLTDPNNNVVAIIDSTGEVKERYCYDAFGKVTYLNPDFSVRITSQYDWDFLFTSRRLDNETGLMYYRNRYYHPIIGRFTSIDPLGYDAGDVNLYRYVNNQPETLVDPMGLDAFIGDCFRMDPPPPEPFTQEELRQMVSEGIYNNISNTLTGIGQTAGGIWSVVGSTVISVGITAGENSGYISPIVGKAWWVLDFVVNPNTIGDAESRNTIPWSPELPPTLPRPVTEEPFTEEPDIEEPDWIWTDDGHCNGGQFCPNPKKSF